MIDSKMEKVAKKEIMLKHVLCQKNLEIFLTNQYGVFVSNDTQ